MTVIYCLGDQITTCVHNITPTRAADCVCTCRHSSTRGVACVCVCVCVCVSSTAGDAEEEGWQLVGHVRAYVGLRQLCNPLKGQCVCVLTCVC